jgi:hypothetical protein
MDCFGFYGLLHNGVFMSRIDIVGQNGNDGLHYELDDGPLTKEQYEAIKKIANVEEIEKKLPYSPEFTYWYERIYLQSPSLCQLQYDDEKMWEAWKAAKQLNNKKEEK